MLVTDEMVEKALDGAPAFEMHPRHDRFLVVVRPAMSGKLQPWEGEKEAQYAPLRFHDFTTQEAANAFIRMERARAALEAVAPAIRAAALEEAARFCDDDADGRYRALRMLPMIPVVATYAEAHARAAASRENAAAIRALKGKEPT